MKRALLALALASISLAPLAGRATTVAEASCRGYSDTAKTADCSTTFELDGTSVFISKLSFGNWFSPGVEGTVVVKWIDAANNQVARLDCTGVGSTGTFGVDLTHICTVSGHPDSYVPGTQTLTAHAENTRYTSATFGASLVLKDAADNTDPL